jgi:hypothetical protein
LADKPITPMVRLNSSSWLIIFLGFIDKFGLENEVMQKRFWLTKEKRLL